MRLRWIGRRLAALTAVALLVIVASVVPARAAPAANFRITLTATVTESDSGGGGFRLNYFAGTGVVPRIGPATFTGTTIVGCGISTECTRTLEIGVVGANGRTLEISGHQEWLAGFPIPAQTWTATGSGFAGAGTYTTTPDINSRGMLEPGTQLTIDLTGTLLQA